MCLSAGYPQKMSVISCQLSALGVRVSEEEIIVFLADGRTVSVPLAWSWRLSEVSQKARQNFLNNRNGQGIHWPDVDEDISRGYVGWCTSPATMRRA